MYKKVIVIVVLCLLLLAVVFDITQYLNLEQLKEHHSNIITLYQENPGLFISVFFISYVLMSALSIPGAAVMTLVAGSIFGLILGSIIVSFASSIGATIAFLIARYLFKDSIESKYQKLFKTIDEKIKEEGAFYLFTLRLIPQVPFFLINLLMGLTNLPTRVFYLISQIGMLPATIIYVNAGKQLASINSLSDILSPNIIIAFILLGTFPLIIKKTVDYFSTKK